VDRIADEIEAQLFTLGKAEVPSNTIGDMVMEHLKKLDHIAYIRFASVYRQFGDITALKKEVDTLVHNRAETARHRGQLSMLKDAD
jgi:transcriptional repressor NrdR